MTKITGGKSNSYYLSRFVLIIGLNLFVKERVRIIAERVFV